MHHVGCSFSLFGKTRIQLFNIKIIEDFIELLVFQSFNLGFFIVSERHIIAEGVIHQVWALLKLLF